VTDCELPCAGCENYARYVKASRKFIVGLQDKILELTKRVHDLAVECADNRGMLGDYVAAADETAAAQGRVVESLREDLAVSEMKRRDLSNVVAQAEDALAESAAETRSARESYRRYVSETEEDIRILRDAAVTHGGRLMDRDTKLQDLQEDYDLYKAAAEDHINGLQDEVEALKARVSGLCDLLLASAGESDGK